jgi:hypothetical protein
MGDLDKNTHVKPDWDNVEFALFMGTSPAQSGNLFKRQAASWPAPVYVTTSAMLWWHQPCH